MKLVMKIVGVLLVVLVIAAGACLMYINSIAKSVIESGGRAALGVDTKLDGINIGILGGTVSLSGLEIENPVDYKTDHFMTLGGASTGITWSSLRGDQVEVPHLTLSGLHMNLEKRKGKANYKVLLDNLAEFTGGKEGEEKPKDDKPGKRFVIRELTIEDVTVTVELLPIGGELVRRPVTIDKIELKDVGTDSDKGALASEVVGTVVVAVLKAVVKTGVDVPVEILEDLGGQLVNVGALGVEVVGKVAEGAGEVVGKAGEAAGKAGEAVGKVGDAVGGLLGGLGKKKDGEPAKEDAVVKPAE